MGVKLTPKQEAFALAYVETGNASEAYRRAYDAQGMKPASVNRKAKELLDNGKITARVRTLQSDAEERHKTTVDDLIAELEEARAEARRAFDELGKPQLSAMVAATMGKARLLGFLDAKTEDPDDDDAAPVKVVVNVVDARSDNADA